MPYCFGACNIKSEHCPEIESVHCSIIVLSDSSGIQFNYPRRIFKVCSYIERQKKCRQSKDSARYGNHNRLPILISNKLDKKNKTYCRGKNYSVRLHEHHERKEYSRACPFLVCKAHHFDNNEHCKERIDLSPCRRIDPCCRICRINQSDYHRPLAVKITLCKFIKKYRCNNIRQNRRHFQNQSCNCTAHYILQSVCNSSYRCKCIHIKRRIIQK